MRNALVFDVFARISFVRSDSKRVEKNKIVTSRGEEGGGGGGGRGSGEAECSCAHCGRQVPLYRCSTGRNLPRNLCTGMRQTSRNERFILAHAVPARNARYFVLIQRPAPVDVMHSHI